MADIVSPAVPRAPFHVAIIMDGNGRWASARGLDRSEGHKAGASNIIRMAKAFQKRGISTLSLFAFSTENWSRPKQEVEALLDLAYDYFKSEFGQFPSMGISLKVIGDRKRLPLALRTMIAKSERSNPGVHSLTLNIAVNYGGKWDIAMAAARLAEKCRTGAIKSSEIDEAALESELSTAGQPPVDLLIRTGGEHRISNFLIWQSAYSELYFSTKYWPDFDETELDLALDEFSKRARRFGGLV
jgi:undecaprenyl diphosphate synthase